MATESVDLGPVLRLDALALGAPGRRTFRLVAANRARLSLGCGWSGKSCRCWA